MAEKATRERIVEVADRLFYQSGFDHTSFADIADAVGISRGNFYHHFKSKDEILDAVIGLRMANTSALLEKWEAEGARPQDRIASFVGILIMNQAKIKSFGCPVGTLCTELSKLDHTAHPAAIGLFELFRYWLGKQFALMGHPADADRLAMHFLLRSQGIATLFNAFHDEEFVRHEVQSMLDCLGGPQDGLRSIQSIT